VSSGAIDQDDPAHRRSSLPPVHRQHSSSSRSPQSPIRDFASESGGGGGAAASTAAGRKTVRFADESPPSPGEPAPGEGGGGASLDLGYTIRPHYPTRAALSTFHSSPTITSSEL